MGGHLEVYGEGPVDYISYGRRARFWGLDTIGYIGPYIDGGQVHMMVYIA